MTTGELISAVGVAMQEAYEQLERRSLESCLAGCFELRDGSDGPVYVPRMMTLSYPGPNGEELIRSPLAARPQLFRHKYPLPVCTCSAACTAPRR